MRRNQIIETNHKDKKRSLQELFPDDFRMMFYEVFENINDIEEIRIRINQPVCIYMKGKEYFISEKGSITKEENNLLVINERELNKLFQHMCDYSPYAYVDEIRKGYITVAGGHRIGVAGQMIYEKEGVYRLKNISFINIRVAHEIIGVSNKILPFLFEGNKILSTLIVAAPGGGKTTLLRDLLRQISDGNEYIRGVKVGIVDERSEIAGCFRGIPQNHVGRRTDVLDGCPKTKGMMMLIRSMSPAVIGIDELGDEEDVRALQRVLYCGCRVIVTIHGENIEEIKSKFVQYRVNIWDMFERIVILEREKQKHIMYVHFREGEIKCLE